MLSTHQEPSLTQLTPIVLESRIGLNVTLLTHDRAQSTPDLRCDRVCDRFDRTVATQDVDQSGVSASGRVTTLTVPVTHAVEVVTRRLVRQHGGREAASPT